MEWCEEFYREMNAESVIRRGVSVVLVMLLLLSMMTSGASLRAEREIQVIPGKNAGMLPAGVDSFPAALGLIADTEDLTVEEKQAAKDVFPEEKADAAELLFLGGKLSAAEEAGFSGITENKRNAADIMGNGGMYQDPVSTDMSITNGSSSGSLSMDMPITDVPTTERPLEEDAAAAVPGTDIPVWDIPTEDSSAEERPEKDTPASDLPSSDENVPAGPDSDIPGAGDAASDPPAADIPEDSADSGNVSDGTADEPAGNPTDGFIIDESGMICGISDISLAVTDLCLNLPAEGCTGIARGAFAGAGAEIVEVHIPSGITCIEEGAFLGLPQVCKFKVADGNSSYYTENGVLFSEDGSCILAFPAGRTGIYSVPAGVTRFASDAFTGSMLSKIDTRACLLGDAGNLPESISIL